MLDASFMYTEIIKQTVTVKAKDGLTMKRLMLQYENQLEISNEIHLIIRQHIHRFL